MTLKGLIWTAPISLAIALVGLSIYISEGALHIRERITPSPSAADYLARQNAAMWQPVAIEAPGGVILRAWFFRPDEFNGAAVLLMHGIADTRLGMTGHLQYLLRNGYAALLPDARGHGSSGGRLVTYGLKEAQDTAMWARWMSSQPGITRIYGLGASMGAAVLIESLARHPGFRAIVAECPFATFREVAEFRMESRLPHLIAWPVIQIAAGYLRLRYGVDLMQASPLAVLGDTDTPVLLIHGTADQNIPEQQSRELHQANLKSTELWEVEGVTHVNTLGAEPQEYRRRVLSWFAEH